MVEHDVGLGSIGKNSMTRCVSITLFYYKTISTTICSPVRFLRLEPRTTACLTLSCCLVTSCVGTWPGTVAQLRTNFGQSAGSHDDTTAFHPWSCVGVASATKAQHI
jgi:hypothetical protein